MTFVATRQLTPDRLEHYEILNGVLLFTPNLTDKSSTRIYVPDDLELRHRIIYEYHDSPIQGHFGYKKTAERVRRHFFWHGMEETIEKYIKSCDRCQRFKHRTRKQSSTTTQQTVPDYPWQVMALDEKSGLPLTKRGNDAVWVFVDKLTKRAHFVATKHKCNFRIP